MDKRISVKILKQVLALVDKHKLDSIEISGLKITKSRHSFKDSGPGASESSEPTTVEEIDAETKKMLGLN
jgi:hypothetical protein